MKDKLLSICIPSYNRPYELLRLLESIDVKRHAGNIEIIICEDNSPKRIEIRETVEKYRSKSKYVLYYYENRMNLGYDTNLRECIHRAHGRWIMFMGDDDMFVPKCMDDYIDFLLDNDDVSYVLRSYQNIKKDGNIEKFCYFDTNKKWNKGVEAYTTLFRKSVFISGFCFKRECSINVLTDIFDGTLLFQLYIMAEICINYSSAYYSIPITQSIDGGIPYFGSSEKEKDFYTPGKVTLDNSVNFMHGFFVISEYIDNKYGFNSTKKIRDDLSKYSYPILAIQRNNGCNTFINYIKQLRKLGIDSTWYFWIYCILLTIMGVDICDWGICVIKRILGRTPQL